MEKRHDSVKRTIKSLVERGVIALPQSVETPTPGGGPATTTYHLDRRDTTVVVAQLSPEFTARVVDRWQELEAQAQPDPVAMLNDPAALLRRVALPQSEETRPNRTYIYRPAPTARRSGALKLEAVG